MFFCIITENCHLHRDQSSQLFVLSGNLQQKNHMRLDRCSVIGKGNLARHCCVFYTTYWQFKDLHTRGNGIKWRGGGSLPAQMRQKPFQQLQHKRLLQTARWCYRLSWMLVHLGMFSCYARASIKPLKALLRSYQMALFQSLSPAWRRMTELGLNPATAVRIQAACTDELDQIWKKMYFQALLHPSWGTGLIVVCPEGLLGW